MRINQDNYVALYCSKLENGRITIEEQLLHLKRYCKHFGFLIVQEYIDIDNVNKPYFSKMVEDIKKFKYDIVISYDFDTLTLNNKQLSILLEEIRNHKCELHLENTYRYHPRPKSLFKLPRKDKDELDKLKEKEKKEKKRKGFIPFMQHHIIEDPKTVEPIDWATKFKDEDEVWFELEPIYDLELNEIITNRRKLCVHFVEITGGFRKGSNPKIPKRKHIPIWEKQSFKK